MTECTDTPKTKILIVDDDSHVVQGLFWPLQLRGYHVESCETAEAALAALDAACFDLVITDVQLPGMSGLALRVEITKRPGAPRIIVITGFGSPNVEQQACREADAYLTKPFSTQVLLETVERVLHDSLRQNREAGR